MIKELKVELRRVGDLSHKTDLGPNIASVRLDMGNGSYIDISPDENGGLLLRSGRSAVPVTKKDGYGCLTIEPHADNTITIRERPR